MGQFLLLTAVAIKSGKKPDWAAAKACLQKLPKKKLQALIDENVKEGDCSLDGVKPSELRKTIAGYLDEFRQAHDCESGALATLNFGAWTLLLAGGETSSDDPSDLFTAMNKVPGDVLKAAGFEWPEDSNE
jgi:hypothetical protein